MILLERQRVSSLIREISNVIYVVILCIFFLVSCKEKSEKVTNFVIIFTDDQGYADVGCFDARGFETPNLDQLANEGMRFTNFYVSEAVCSASRSSLLTGCYSERISIQGALAPWTEYGLNPEEETIAEVLKKKGYATAIFGKWHLGNKKEYLPLQHGFDEYFGLPYSNDMWPVGYDGLALDKSNPDSKPWKLHYPTLALIDGNEKVEEIHTLNDQATLTTRYTERAVQFIERNHDKPFFLYVPHSMPHVPLAVSKKFKGKSIQGLYGDVIMEIDWSMGEILKTLRKYNLEEKTLIIFTSDNGPWLNFGNHAGSAVPLREGKGTAWEGGVRVPCIMRWPGVIPAGSVCDKIAATIDLLPTFAAIANAPLQGKAIDGVNILSLLQGKENSIPRDHYFCYYGGNLCAVRKGKWKLYFPHEYRSYQNVEPGKDGYPGPYGKGKTDLELYDLDQDISETENVAQQYPEIVTQLESLAEKARVQFGDRLTNHTGNAVRAPGRFTVHKKNVKHRAVGKGISLKYRYNNKYPGGGDYALIDGSRGTTDHMDGTWQGYEKDNLEALIDLGKIESLQRITCGFLENHFSWIFLPTSVEIAISQDNKAFRVVKHLDQQVKNFNPRPDIQDIVAEFSSTSARYIRIKAKNVAVCPEWHPGAGGKAWIFVDEIIVE